MLRIMDDALLDLYSARMKALGAEVRDDRRLPTPTVTVKRRSPLCGSQITLDLALDAGGRVTATGFAVRACALSAAASAILITAAVGCDVVELRRIRDLVRAMLKGEEVIFPGGRWADLEILRPAQMVRSRHGSAMLPFEAAVEALETALGADPGMAPETAQGNDFSSAAGGTA